jgi:hypothetical protein
LKYKKSENKATTESNPFSIWFCVVKTELALCSQAEKKAENADI